MGRWYSRQYKELMSRGLTKGKKRFGAKQKRNGFLLVKSPDGRWLPVFKGVNDFTCRKNDGFNYRDIGKMRNNGNKVTRILSRYHRSTAQ